jgi:chemotaxis regulatin CheY-phosphate phosphatase CheZ
MDLIHLELVELLDRIQSTKSEVAALRPSEGATDQIMMATMELEAVVQATEQATSDILEAAEGLQNTVDLLRSSDLTLAEIPSIAEHLEDAATNILMTCSFQDITGQRINAAVNTLLYVEESLSRIVELWGISAGTADASLQRNAPSDERPDKELLHGPQMDGHGVSQDDIDKLFG